MNSVDRFSGEVSRVRKLWRRVAVERIGRIGLVLLLALYAAAFGLEKLRGGSVQPFPVLIVLSGAALLAATLWIVFTRPKTLELLIGFDRRLHLQDRLSTAYECTTQESRSPFAELLIRDAGKRLGALNRKTLFPKRWTSLHLVLGVLILIDIPLFWTDLFSRPPAPAPETIRRMETTLDTLPAFPPRKPAADAVGREMAALADALRDPSPNRSRLYGALNRLLKEIQSEKIRLAKTFADRIETGPVEGLSVRDIDPAAALSTAQIRWLREMLSKLPETPAPGEEMAELALLEAYEAGVRNMIDLLDSDPAASGSSSRGVAGKDTDGPRRSPPGEERTDSTDPAEAGHGSRGETAAAGDGEKTPPGYEDGDGPDSDGSSAPGRHRAESGPAPARAMDTASGDVAQDRAQPAQQPEYAVLIRSLTAVGEAKTETADISRTYRQEIESVLTKEEIPIGYREFIKNYFLSIGLGKEAENR